MSLSKMLDLPYSLIAFRYFNFKLKMIKSQQPGRIWNRSKSSLPLYFHVRVWTFFLFISCFILIVWSSCIVNIFTSSLLDLPDDSHLCLLVVPPSGLCNSGLGLSPVVLVWVGFFFPHCFNLVFLDFWILPVYPVDWIKALSTEVGLIWPLCSFCFSYFSWI